VLLLITLLATKWLSAETSDSSVMEVPQTRAGERGRTLPARADAAMASAMANLVSILDY